MTSFGNMDNAAAAGSVHVRNPATWLSATLPQGNNMATTLDQEMAKFISQDVPFPSLELASETTVQVAAGNGGPFTTLSFRDEHTPLPMEYNPRKVFLQLFGEGELPAERAAMARQNEQHSGHDPGTAPTNWKATWAAKTARFWTGIWTNVREVERRAKMAAQLQPVGIKIPNAPVGELEDFAEQVKLMYDLLALAYQADLTRVATYVTVAEGTNRNYPFLNVSGGFHPISHHADLTGAHRDADQIQKWHMQMFADFVKKMADTPDGQGSLLDHSIFMYGSNMSNSQPAQQLPDSEPDRRRRQRQAEAGRAAPGAAGAHAHREPASDADAEGGPWNSDHFGDSTGTITEI